MMQKIAFITAVSITIVLVTMSTTVVFAQQNAEKILSSMKRWTDLAAPEKLYVLSDKDVYSAGETIWMSVWVVDGITHEPGTVSGMVHIDLVDTWGQSLLSKMFQTTVGRAAAQLELPVDLPTGEYQLRAYTKRMRDYDEGFQFRRSLRILNRDIPPVGPSYSFANDTLTVAFSIDTSGDDLPTDRDVTIQITTANGAVIYNAGNFRASSAGTLYADIPATSDWWGDDDPRIHLTWSDRRRSHNLTFRIPPQGSEPAVRFFPESGHLVHQIPTRVAFKAAFADGSSADVAGVVRNQNGDEVARFQSVFEGLGYFEIVPDAAQRYIAVVDLPGNKEVQIDLPSVKQRGLHLTVEPSQIGAAVRLYSTEPRNDLTIIAHQRGTPVWAALSAEPRFLLEGFIPADRLRSGIIHVTAFDSTGNPIAERLFYHGNTEDTLQVTPLAPERVYRTRSKVQIPLQFEVQGTVAYPSVAIRVTEEAAGNKQALDITSWLQIGSDLHGSIPNLGRFMYGEGRAHVDLLMMTHGWRRFKWDDLLNQQITPLPEASEGFDVRGRVTLGRNREGVAGSKVVILHRSGDGGVGESITDSQGYFTVKDMVFPDSTQITVHADDGGGRFELRIELLDIITPRGGSRYLPNQFSRSMIGIYADYMESVRQRLAVDRSYGLEMPAITLAEITVTDTRLRDRPIASRLLVDADRVIRVQEQPHVAGKVLDFLARQSVGLQVTQEYDGIRHYWVFRDRSSSSLFQNEFCNNQGCIPLLLIDGMEADWRRDAGLLNATDVDVIEVLRGPNAAIYGSRAAGGVVSIMTRSGREVERSNLSNISVSGYSHPREFYSPDYGVVSDINRKPDLRSTLYWAPAKAANDQGVMQIEFWTGDRTGRWVVGVEGIDEYGATVRYQRPIVVAE
jgi:hypothetical protein